MGSNGGRALQFAKTLDKQMKKPIASGCLGDKNTTQPSVAPYKKLLFKAQAKCTNKENFCELLNYENAMKESSEIRLQNESPKVFLRTLANIVS